MTQSASDEVGPNGLVRLNYQDGQMLDATEFRVEQQYFVDVMRLHTQAYFSAGVAYGMTVSPLTASGGRYQLTIAAGVGVDAFGHHVILTRPKVVTLPRPSDITQPTDFDVSGGGAATPASNQPGKPQMPSIAGSIDLFLRYQLSAQTLPQNGGIQRLRLVEAPAVVVRAEVKVGDILSPYYFDENAQPMLEIPGQALGFRVVRIEGDPPSQVPKSTQVSLLRSAAAAAGTQIPLAPPLVLQGTGALSSGKATVTVPNWPAFAHLAPGIIPQVWPYLNTPVSAPVQVSQVVASQLSAQGAFDVVALDTTNPSQPFSWALRLTP